MRSATIYINPACSKCRASLALLQARGLAVDQVAYLSQPPDLPTLRRLLRQLELPVTALLRFDEPRARELGLQPDDVRSEDEWLHLLHANPILLQRPIVVIGDSAVLGRPPENLLRLL